MLILQISLGIVVTSLIVAIAIPIIGLFLPKRIALAQSHSFFVPTDQLSQLLLQPDTYPRWRPEVKSVTILNASHHEWEECYGNEHCIQYRAQIEDQAHVIHQYSIKNRSPFKVNRTFKIWEQDHMSFLKVEDELFISTPYLRSLAYIFYNHKLFLQQEMKSFSSYAENSF